MLTLCLAKRERLLGVIGECGRPEGQPPYLLDVKSVNVQHRVKPVTLHFEHKVRFSQVFPVFLLSGLKAPSWCFRSLLVLFLLLPSALLGNDLFLCLCPIYSLRLDGEDFCLFMIITPGLDTLEEKGSKYTAPANLHYYCEFFYLAG